MVMSTLTKEEAQYYHDEGKAAASLFATKRRIPPSKRSTCYSARNRLSTYIYPKPPIYPSPLPFRHRPFNKHHRSAAIKNEKLQDLKTRLTIADRLDFEAQTSDYYGQQWKPITSKDTWPVRYLLRAGVPATFHMKLLPPSFKSHPTAQQRPKSIYKRQKKADPAVYKCNHVEDRGNALKAEDSTMSSAKFLKTKDTGKSILVPSEFEHSKKVVTFKDTKPLREENADKDEHKTPNVSEVNDVKSNNLLDPPICSTPNLTVSPNQTFDSDNSAILFPRSPISTHSDCSLKADNAALQVSEVSIEDTFLEDWSMNAQSLETILEESKEDEPISPGGVLQSLAYDLSPSTAFFTISKSPETPNDPNDLDKPLILDTQ
ncbi:hypothetical protein L204_100436 [Cryptococcus depauperatus]